MCVSNMLDTVTANLELGRQILAGGVQTNFHDAGRGEPVLMLHGSGPGVSAFVNWQAVMPRLALHRRVIAPDIVGFGFTERPAWFEYGLDKWVTHVVALLDALNLQKVDLVGNSFGGGLALALAIRHPSRVRRLVLMGSVGVPFEITPALDAVWGYQPSLEGMKELMSLFAFDESRVTETLAIKRYEASIRPGVQEAYASMFPMPRQRSVAALCSTESAIRALKNETLVIHGREDRVIPLENALTLSNWIPNSQLHVFGKCGHWTQIEHAARFTQLVDAFLSEAP